MKKPITITISLIIAILAFFAGLYVGLYKGQTPILLSQAPASIQTVLAYDMATDSVKVLKPDDQMPAGAITFLEVPQSTTVISQKKSDDGFIYFTVDSWNDYKNPGADWSYGQGAVAAFQYDIKAQKSKLLFLGRDMPKPYAFILDIDSKAGLAAYQMTVCNNCDAGRISTVIVDVNSQNGSVHKDLGEVYNFKFTGNGTYEYAPAVETKDCEVEYCSEPGPMKTGKF